MSKVAQSFYMHIAYDTMQFSLTKLHSDFDLAQFSPIRSFNGIASSACGQFKRNLSRFFEYQSILGYPHWITDIDQRPNSLVELAIWIIGTSGHFTKIHSVTNAPGASCKRAVNLPWARPCWFNIKCTFTNTLPSKSIKWAVDKCIKYTE